MGIQSFGSDEGHCRYQAMRDLFDIQRDLQDTHAALAHMELSLTKQNVEKFPSLMLTVSGLKTRQQILEAEFLKAANLRGQDVCTYRLFPREGNPTIDALTKALGSFQHLFTSVFSALKHGPIERLRTNVALAEATSFRFGYTFPGSLGVAFTLPNDRLLPGMQSELDASMSTIRQLSKTDSKEKIAKFARELGEAPIRATYRWAENHVNSSLAANIGWRREEEIRDEFTVQPIELEALKNTIDMSGAETVETITVRGVLVAANTVRHTFHLITDEESDIRGKYNDAISEDQTVELPKRYTAIIKKTTILQYSSEYPDITYFLVKLSS